MNYSIYKLNFDSPVHFGQSDTALNLESASDHMLADSLFSALCHEILSQKGIEALNDLVDKVENNEIVISDTFPWKEDEDGKVSYFLPKPILQGNRNRKKEIDNSDSKDRKVLKNIKWIPVNEFDKFVNSLNEGIVFKPSDNNFGDEVQFVKVKIPEDPTADSEPYYVGVYEFDPKAGLYFILGYEEKGEKKLIDRLVEGLHYSGIGGKVSSGYGKFHIDDVIDLEETDDKELKRLLEKLSEDSDQYMLLTSSLPKDNELDKALADATFNLIRRSGFVQSDTFSDTLVKKKNQFFLTSGSILKNKFEGKVYDVAPENGNHKVFRYSKPLFISLLD